MRFHYILAVSAGAIAALLGTSASAGDTASSRPVGVVELFTSQGCSSCPKADAAIAELANDPEIVTITYHVDYWNYLGWQDTLAAKENTDRQYAYAKTLGNSNVYTPQVVLNGIHDMRAAAPVVIRGNLEKLSAEGRGFAVPVTAELSADELTVSVGTGTGKADVVIAYFTRATVVDIERGENEGRRVTYRNSVTKMETVGMWDGKALTIKLPASMLGKQGQEGCAILLQSHDKQGNPGRIYGAAAL